MTQKNRSLQLIRAAAAAAVYICHCGLFGERGYFGADILCVLCGYTAMLSSRRYEGRGAEGAGIFMLKRIIRIVPLYWLGTLAMYLLLVIYPAASPYSIARPEYLIKSLLFIPYSNEIGYSVPLLGAGWSIEYILFFSLLFSLSMWIADRCGRYELRGLICTVMTGIMCLLHLVPWKGYAMTFLTDSFLLEFVLGMGIYAAAGVYDRGRSSGKDTEDETAGKKTDGPVLSDIVILAAGAAAFVFMVCAPDAESGVLRCIQTGLPAAAAVYACAAAGRRISVCDLLVRLGDTSYSFFIIEYFTAGLFKVLTAGSGMGMKAAVCAVLMAVSWAASYVSWLFIEKRTASVLNK